MATATTRHQVLSDEQWERIEPPMPSNEGLKGRPFRDNRKIVEDITYRSRTGIPWRDLPRDQFGPRQTVWKRHCLYAQLGVWDRIHAALMAQADAGGDIDWTVSVDSTINATTARCSSRSSMTFESVPWPWPASVPAYCGGR